MDTTAGIIATVISAGLVAFGVLWRAYAKKDKELQECNEARRVLLQAQFDEYRSMKEEALKKDEHE